MELDQIIKEILEVINIPYNEESLLLLDQYTIYFRNIKEENAYILDKLNKQLKNYKDISKYLEDKDFEDILDDKIDILKKTYKSMLKYKDKKYDPTWSFKELSTIVSNYYNYYYDDINLAYQIAISNTIYNKKEDYETIITDTERILLLDEIISKLSNYQEHAYDYEDFELESGQTYEDLLDLEDLKYEELYKEILDYHNIEYNEGDNYEELAIIYYPPLKDILKIVHSASLHSGTYIDILDTMEKYYNKIKEDYKKY